MPTYPTAAEQLSKLDLVIDQVARSEGNSLFESIIRQLKHMEISTQDLRKLVLETARKQKQDYGRHYPGTRYGYQECVISLQNDNWWSEDMLKSVLAIIAAAWEVKFIVIESMKRPIIMPDDAQLRDEHLIVLVRDSSTVHYDATKELTIGDSEHDGGEQD